MYGNEAQLTDLVHPSIRDDILTSRALLIEKSRISHTSTTRTGYTRARDDRSQGSLRCIAVRKKSFFRILAKLKLGPECGISSSLVREGNACYAS